MCLAINPRWRPPSSSRATSRQPPKTLASDTVERARTEARSGELRAALHATLRSESAAAAAAQPSPRRGSGHDAESWWTRNDDLLDEEGIEDSEPVRPDAWIECAFCDRWMHSRCLGLSAAEHGALHDMSHPIYGGNASEHFMCAECVEIRTVRIINELVCCDTPGYFLCPVTDAIAPGYSDLIAEPMCFQEVRECAEDGKYTSAFHGAQRLRRDVALVALNAITFNGMDSGVGQLAASLLDEMDRLLYAWLPLTALGDVERRARTLVHTAAEHKAQEARRREERKAEKLKEHAAVTVCCSYLPLHFKRILLTILTCPPHILTGEDRRARDADRSTFLRRDPAAVAHARARHGARALRHRDVPPVRPHRRRRRARFLQRLRRGNALLLYLARARRRLHRAREAALSLLELHVVRRLRNPRARRSARLVRRVRLVLPYVLHPGA